MAEILDNTFIPYGPIPTQISKNLNTREREIFRILMGLSKHGAQSVWVRQQTIAEWTHCHIDTVGRAIRSIVKKGFLKFTGAWHQGRHKVYQLIFKLIVTADKRTRDPLPKGKDTVVGKKSMTEKEGACDKNINSDAPIPDKNAGRPPAKPTGHARQFYQNIKNRFNNNFNNKSLDNKKENQKDKIYQQAVQKFVDKNYAECLKLCKIRQAMSYDLHLPTLKLQNRCFDLMRKHINKKHEV